jgi:hypothetical protein
VWHVREKLGLKRENKKLLISIPGESEWVRHDPLPVHLSPTVLYYSLRRACGVNASYCISATVGNQHTGLAFFNNNSFNDNDGDDALDNMIFSLTTYLKLQPLTLPYLFLYFTFLLNTIVTSHILYSTYLFFIIYPQYPLSKYFLSP